MRHCVNDVRKGRQFLRRPMYRPAIPTASVLERRYYILKKKSRCTIENDILLCEASNEFMLFAMILRSVFYQSGPLTHISLAPFLWDIDKENSPRCDATKCGFPSEAILFAYMIFIEKRNRNEKVPLMTLKVKVDSSK